MKRTVTIEFNEPEFTFTDDQIKDIADDAAKVLAEVASQYFTGKVVDKLVIEFMDAYTAHIKEAREEMGWKD